MASFIMNVSTSASVSVVSTVCGPVEYPLLDTKASTSASVSVVSSSPSSRPVGLFCMADQSIVTGIVPSLIASI